jgi:hypothetical protein
MGSAGATVPVRLHDGHHKAGRRSARGFKKGVKMPFQMFRPGHKLHGKKLECWETWRLVMWIGFSSLVVTVTGSLVMLFVKDFVTVAHDGATLAGVLKFLSRALLAAAIGVVLLFNLLFASRMIKVLGERLFP